MADLQTVAISLDSMKVRWEEPYVSEALNRQKSAIPAGVYRGCVLAAMSPNSKSFRIAPDPLGAGMDNDSCFVFFDKANNYGTVFQDDSEYVFNMSAQFSGGGGSIPADVVWYVWADIVYQPSVVTDGDFHVTLSPPPDGTVFIGMVYMSAGMTTVPDGVFNQQSMTRPYPTKREDAVFSPGDILFGFLNGGDAWNIPTANQKRAMNAASPAPTALNPFVTKGNTLDKVMSQPSVIQMSITPDTKFLLSAKVYVGTSGSAMNVKNFFALHMSSGTISNREFLRGSDGRQISISEIRKDVSGVPGAVVIPATDADADGFIQNVWIYGDFSKTSDTLFPPLFDVWCSTHTTFSGALPSGLANSIREIFGHANTTRVGAETGSPDSLSSHFLQETLRTMLGMVNARVKTIHPTASPSDWTLLWRSHNVTSDANVTKDTISTYFWNGSHIRLVGGYLVPGTYNVCAGKDADTRSVTMTWELNAGPYDISFIRRAIKVAPAGGSTWDIFTGWTNLVSDGPGDTSFQNQNIYLVGGSAYITGSLPDAGDRYLLFQSPSTTGVGKTRIYFGRGTLTITCNCSWSNTYHTWSADVNDGSIGATAIEIRSGDIVMHKKHKSDSINSPWSEMPDQWTTCYYMLSSVIGGPATASEACPYVTGIAREVVKFSTAFRVPYDVTPSTNSQYAWIPLTLHSHHETIPTHYTFIYEEESDIAGTGGDWSNGVDSVTHKDGWGGMILVSTVPYGWSKGDMVSCHGYVIIDT